MRHHIIYIVLALAAGTLTAHAQPRALDLQQCIARALQGNLWVAGAQKAVEKSQTLQKTAFDLESTSISFSQDLTTGGNPDNGITVGQSFSMPSVYAARKRSLRAQTAVEQANKAVVESEVVRQVTSTYYSLLHLGETLRVLRMQEQASRHFLHLAQVRLQAGEANALETINAEKMLNDAAAGIRNTQAQQRQLSLAMQQLLGMSEEFVPADTALSVIAYAEGTAGPDSMGNPALQAVLRAQEDASRRNYELEKKQLLPTVSVALTGQLLIKGLNPYNIERERFKHGNFMAFEVGVALPLFNRAQKARIQAAKQDVAMAEIATRQAMQDLNGKYRSALSDYHNAKENLRQLQLRGSEWARRLTSISTLAYEQGEIGYVEYIQNLNTSLGIQLEQANAINSYNQSVINLKYLQGIQ